MMRRINIKELFQNRKTLYFTLCIILISVLSLTIVYAALSVTLNITGSTEVTASNWDIHLANPEVKSGSVNSNVPTISGNNLSFSVNLVMPGDYYEFTVDVVNDGSIDAMIDGVVKTPTLTTEQAKYLNNIVEYQNGESINTKQLVAKNSFVRLKIRVEFRKDITTSDLPTTSETLNLAFTVNYVQSDGSEDIVIIENNGKIIKIASGDLDTIGSEVCIKEECFYVISSTEETVTMLAKMNITEDNVPIQSSVKTAIAFGNANYSSSTVKKYVDNYNIYLSTQGIVPIEARLITRDELAGLGCSLTAQSCSAAPSWVYSSAYWTGDKRDNRSVYIVKSDASLSSAGTTALVVGVRPVITISRDYL